MLVLRQLSAIYIMAASTYAVVIVLAQHPDLAAATKSAADYTAGKSVAAAAVLNDDVLQPGWALVREQSGRAYAAAMAALNPPKPETAPVREAQRPVPAQPARAKDARIEKPKPAAPAPTRPVAPTVVARAPAISHQPQTTVTLDLVPPAKSVAPSPAPPANGSPGPADLARVQQRLKDNLTGDLYAHFDLFLYVSKAEKGPLAQRMYVFAKDDAGNLTLRDNWPVSTGREKVEYNKAGWKLPSYTPKGYYELDPHRMYRHYRSIQWGLPMPYAMFFNWVRDGDMTGLAIHAAQPGEVPQLGQRASAGCIRLAPEDAHALFDLIRTRYKGPVPRFAYDSKTETMSSDGMLMRDAKGTIRFTDGYKVLVVIENYGGENVVAALM